MNEPKDSWRCPSCGACCLDHEAKVKHIRWHERSDIRLMQAVASGIDLEPPRFGFQFNCGD